MLLDIGSDTGLLIQRQKGIDTWSQLAGKMKDLFLKKLFKLVKFWIKLFSAGGISAGLSKTLTSPLERLKILYQVNTGQSPSILAGKEKNDFLKKVWNFLKRFRCQSNVERRWILWIIQVDCI